MPPKHQKIFRDYYTLNKKKVVYQSIVIFQVSVVELDRIQYLSNIVVEYEVCIPVCKRLIPVDYYQIFSAEIISQGSRRLNCKRSAADNKAVSSEDQTLRLDPCGLRKSFAIKRNIRPYHTAAFGALGDRTF